MLAVPQTASAHPTWHEAYRQTWRDPGGACSNVHVRQEHAWHFVNQSSCGFRVQFAQLQYYYKVPTWGAAGEFCFSEGYNYSPSGVSTFEKFYPWDIGNWCNYGGRHHYISIDEWAYAIYPYGGWMGEGVRPITFHCHCP